MVLMMQLDTNTLSYEAIVKYGFTSPLWPVLTSALNGARTFAYRNREGDIRLAEHQRDALIRCHSHSLSHALAEIIANALSFSSEGQSVRVTQWADGQNVYIEVADQGAGMTADQIQQALKPFEQVDRDTKEQQGIGLGLTIAQQVIAAHGGSLYINSQVGSGTQVTVQLPLSQMDINA
jgi:signal transduction histidine kinase